MTTEIATTHLLAVGSDGGCIVAHAKTWDALYAAIKAEAPHVGLEPDELLDSVTIYSVALVNKTTHENGIECGQLVYVGEDLGLIERGAYAAYGFPA